MIKDKMTTQPQHYQRNIMERFMDERELAVFTESYLSNRHSFHNVRNSAPTDEERKIAALFLHRNGKTVRQIAKEHGTTEALNMCTMTRLNGGGKILRNSYALLIRFTIVVPSGVSHCFSVMNSFSGVL